MSPWSARQKARRSLTYVNRFGKKRKSKKTATRNYVKAQISRNIEKRHQEGTMTNQEITSTAQFVSLIAVAGGDSASNRQGQKITPQRFEMRGKINGRSEGNAQIVRLVVFQWKPNRGELAPTLADQILDSSSVFAPLQTDGKMFRLLLDRTITLPAEDATAGYNGYVYRWVFGKSKMSPMSFHTNDSTEDTNHLYLMVLGENATGTSAVYINGVHQLRFMDA